MYIEIRAEDVDELVAKVPQYAPWMHPYQFNDVAVTGYFKGWNPARTHWLHHEDGYAAAKRHAQNFSDLKPDYFLEHIGKKFDVADFSLLDIASATGMYSFLAAERGFKQITAVEIRAEQVEQAQLVQRLAQNIDTSRVELIHDPMSADAPNYLVDQQYDVVLSLGLLYHLANPVQHILNLGRITRKVLVLKTLIHRRFARYWQLVIENPEFITKATEGVSWIGHYSEVHRLLTLAGFTRIESLTPPGFEAASDAFQLKTRSNLHMYWETILRRTGIKPNLQKMYDAMETPVSSPAYYTYVAYKD